MIDIESEVFTFVAEGVRAAFPDAFVTGEYVKAPPRFPALSVVEYDNHVYARTSTSGETENHAELMYQLDAYSNKSVGKKSECRAIMAAADCRLRDLGFTRTFMQPVPNEIDATVYRITARYSAVASKNKVIYRRY